MDVRDSIIEKEIEQIVYGERQPCSVLRVQRRAGCLATQAARCLNSFFKANEGREGLYAVYTVTGTQQINGVDVSLMRLCLKEERDAVLDSLSNAQDQGVYAILTEPLQELSSILRSDHVESAKYQFADGKHSSVNSEEIVAVFRSRLSQSALQEAKRAAEVAAEIAQASSSSAAANVKEHKPKTGRKEDASIQALFEKAQRRARTPTKSPLKPLRDSPFKTPNAKESSESPVRRKRGRRIITDSDGDSPGKEPDNDSGGFPQAQPDLPKKRSPRKKASFENDELFDANDSSPEKTHGNKEMHETREITENKVIEVDEKRNPSQRTLKLQRRSASPEKPKLAVTSSGEKRRKIVKIQGQETVEDEDGFLVTRPTMVEMEVDEEEDVDDKNHAKKNKERALKPSNSPAVTAKAVRGRGAKAGGQRSIASFFSKK